MDNHFNNDETRRVPLPGSEPRCLNSSRRSISMTIESRSRRRSSPNAAEAAAG